MSTERKDIEAVVEQLRQSPDRSTLFWWMLDNYQELAEAAEDTRNRWTPLCERLAALGLVDGVGKPPRPENARQTWYNVRHVVEARQASERKRTELKQQQARMPATWRPQEATPSPPTRPFAPQARTGVSTVINYEDCTPKESLAGLRRILAERSGRCRSRPLRRPVPNL